MKEIDKLKNYGYCLEYEINDIEVLSRTCSAISSEYDNALLGNMDDIQKLFAFKYFKVLNQLCISAISCLKTNAYSTVEVLSRVIIEQSANLTYISSDNGCRAKSLVKSSMILKSKNGKSWAAYLDAEGATNPAAQARQSSGEIMTKLLEVKWPKTGNYPNIRQLFKIIGWEGIYHSYYVPLCDSVHTFSEGFFNLFSASEIFKASPQDCLKLMRYQKEENKRYSIYCFAVAVLMRCEALATSLEGLSLGDEEDRLKTAAQPLIDMIDRHDEYDHARL